MRLSRRSATAGVPNNSRCFGLGNGPSADRVDDAPKRGTVRPNVQACNFAIFALSVWNSARTILPWGSNLSTLTNGDSSLPL